MLLSEYIADTRRQLQNPSATTALYSTDALTRFINIGRRQIAGEAMCVRAYTNLATIAAQQAYDFSSIVVPNAATKGIGSVIHVRQGSIVVGDGQMLLKTRSFEYFNLYFMNIVVPQQDRPTDYAQFGQGTNGSVYVYPVPNDAYTLRFDSICLPVDLVDDTTPDCIPEIWTDAVPYFAAFMALTSVQRSADAKMKLEAYHSFVDAGRRAANPDELMHLYMQGTDLTLTNKLGMKPPGGG